MSDEPQKEEIKDEIHHLQDTEQDEFDNDEEDEFDDEDDALAILRCFSRYALFSDCIKNFAEG